MLIECIGLPGAGKTTTAARIGEFCPCARRRTGEVRKLLYRAYRILDAIPLPRFGDAPRPPAEAWTHEHRGCVPGRDPSLRWREMKAVAYQMTRQWYISDELLLHGLFARFGPLARPTDEDYNFFSALVTSTYKRDRVLFVYIRPEHRRWVRQVAERQRGASRFGRSTPPGLMAELMEDCLYANVLLEILRERGYRLVALLESSEEAWLDLGDRIRKEVQTLDARISNSPLSPVE